MKRFTTVPLLAAALACSDTTGLDRTSREVAGPSFQEGASNAECTGPLSGTFLNVVVPEGETCILSNSTLMGNLKALPGSRLVSDGNNVSGSIQTDKARRVIIIGGTVGGNIQIADGVREERPPDGGQLPPVLEGDYTVTLVTLLQGDIHVIKNEGRIEVTGNNLGGAGGVLRKGNIKIEDNNVLLTEGDVFALRVSFNMVPQNIQVFKNKGTDLKFVTSNVADESVQCWENDPVFAGAFNVAPKLEGQCVFPPTPS